MDDKKKKVIGETQKNSQGFITLPDKETKPTTQPEVVVIHESQPDKDKND